MYISGNLWTIHSIFWKASPQTHESSTPAGVCQIPDFLSLHKCSFTLNDTSKVSHPNVQLCKCDKSDMPIRFEGSRNRMARWLEEMKKKREETKLALLIWREGIWIVVRQTKAPLIFLSVLCITPSSVEIAERPSGGTPDENWSEDIKSVYLIFYICVCPIKTVLKHTAAIHPPGGITAGLLHFSTCGYMLLPWLQSFSLSLSLLLSLPPAEEWNVTSCGPVNLNTQMRIL